MNSSTSSGGGVDGLVVSGHPSHDAEALTVAPLVTASCEIEECRPTANERMEPSKGVREELRILDAWIAKLARLRSQALNLEDEEMPGWGSSSSSGTIVKYDDKIEKDLSSEKMEPEKSLAKDIVASQAHSETKWLQISTKAFASSSSFRPDFHNESGFMNITFGR